MYIPDVCIKLLLFMENPMQTWCVREYLEQQNNIVIKRHEEEGTYHGTCN